MCFFVVVDSFLMERRNFPAQGVGSNKPCAIQSFSIRIVYNFSGIAEVDF
jgi:hypothetical protein